NDSVVWIPDRSVLFAGDLIFNGGTPFVLMGSVTGTISVLEEVIAPLNAQTIVPGHGAVFHDPRPLVDTLDYLRFVPDLAAGGLVDRARREQVRVVWVQPSSDMLEEGTEEWRIVPELAPGDTEPLVAKTYPDSFEDTTLESVLSGLAVGRLVVTGAQTDECIR